MFVSGRWACAVVALLLPALALAAAPIMPKPPAVDALSYLLIDADSQKVLVEHNGHQALPPASLTKIMTHYLVAAELEAGRASLDDMVPVSERAWRMEGSTMFIDVGSEVRLEDLLRGLIIQSGNDASVALAEYVAGTEEAFADTMNQQALQLGMQNSMFENASGWPSDNHRSSAWDMALLTRSLIKRFPDTYAIYAEPEFKYLHYDPQANRNLPLLRRDKTVDGVKTGYTGEAGYCLVASAVRDGMRLISVVMGVPGANTREGSQNRMLESHKLLTYGFRHFETQKLYQARVPLKTAQLWYGELEEVELGVEEDMYATIPRGHYGDLQAELTVARVIEAPLAKGDEVGELRLRLFDETIHRVPLVALQGSPEAGVLSRFGDAIYLFFRGFFGDE